MPGLPARSRDLPLSELPDSRTAQARGRYGYRKIRVLLNREGLERQSLLAYRLYHEEGFGLRPRRSRRRAAEPRGAGFTPQLRNRFEVPDFVADQLADGRRFVL
jgi:putative transposase